MDEISVGKKRRARRRAKPGEMIITRTGEQFERLVEEFVSSGMKSSEFCRTLRPRTNTTSIALAFWAAFSSNSTAMSREAYFASCFSVLEVWHTKFDDGLGCSFDLLLRLRIKTRRVACPLFTSRTGQETTCTNSHSAQSSENTFTAYRRTFLCVERLGWILFLVD